MSVQSKRKSWRKRVQARYPWLTVKWVNGFLCDKDGIPFLLVSGQPPRILKHGDGK